jgi:hypothetical protein
MKLRTIAERIIGKTNIKIDIMMPINLTKHAEERKTRKEGETTNKDIMTASKKALPKIIELLLQGKIKAATIVLVRDKNINVLAQISGAGNDKYTFNVITVMNKKDFENRGNHREIHV